MSAIDVCSTLEYDKQDSVVNNKDEESISKPIAIVNDTISEDNLGEDQIVTDRVILHQYKAGFSTRKDRQK